MQLSKVTYSMLNSRQKERFNFQKVSALLADYGFATLKLDDDWQGADFIAVHTTGEHLKVQLKSRLTFDEKYRGKKIFVAFPHGSSWYLIDHDELLLVFLDRFRDSFGASSSWLDRKGYSWSGLNKDMLALIEPYKL